MKYFIHIAFLIFSFTHIDSFSQEKEIKGYRIDGDEVVFTFDKRDYTEATNENTKERLEFKDFDIKNVVVAGNFNSWSRDSWKMTQITENIYELRKRLDEFKDDFNWEFKFVINSSIWAEPDENVSNITFAKDGDKNYYTYNLKLYNGYPSKNGNAKFFLKGYRNAKKVILAGSFNKWNEELFAMKKTNDG